MSLILTFLCCFVFNIAVYITPSNLNDDITITLAQNSFINTSKNAWTMHNASPFQYNLALTIDPSLSFDSVSPSSITIKIHTIPYLPDISSTANLIATFTVVNHQYFTTMINLDYTSRNNMISPSCGNPVYQYPLRSLNQYQYSTITPPSNNTNFSSSISFTIHNDPMANISRFTYQQDGNFMQICEFSKAFTGPQGFAMYLASNNINESIDIYSFDITLNGINTEPPTKLPTANPTSYPTIYPTEPSAHPSVQPTINPSRSPTSEPTNYPLTVITNEPSDYHSVHPTMQQSDRPTISHMLFSTVDNDMEVNTSPNEDILNTTKRTDKDSESTPALEISSIMIFVTGIVIGCVCIAIFAILCIAYKKRRDKKRMMFTTERNLAADSKPEIPVIVSKNKDESVLKAGMSDGTNEQSNMFMDANLSSAIPGVNNDLKSETTANDIGDFEIKSNDDNCSVLSSEGTVDTDVINDAHNLSMVPGSPESRIYRDTFGASTLGKDVALPESRTVGEV